jgi:Tfp pilus assembly protein PilF
VTPASASVLLAAAVREERKGHDDAALELYRKTAYADPGNVQAIRRVAVLYDRRGEFDKAESAYRLLMQVLPEDANLFNDWGYSCYLRGDWEEARRKFQCALKLDPQSTLVRCNLARTLAQEGQYEGAMETFRDASVSEADAHLEIASACAKRGRLADARRECRLARECDVYLSSAVELEEKLGAGPESPMPADAVARKKGRYDDLHAATGAPEVVVVPRPVPEVAVVPQPATAPAPKPVVALPPADQLVPPPPVPQANVTPVDERRIIYPIPGETAKQAGFNPIPPDALPPAPMERQSR